MAEEPDDEEDDAPARRLPDQEAAQRRTHDEPAEAEEDQPDEHQKNCHFYTPK
ncbi:MAG: hypothetical protein IPP57_14225 [Candidatus Obscuribacter sp.]|nr:hypothetical protein [Candidatus Obscuribacter sp.]MBK9200882.1 hypothetical protein [Candidatus Obscuribacter sp.]MBK9621565.1 hypothetical protein [Candidatus Obscuribacter sp.]MBK9771953.1 hypothetical protein [Candidatus Obscuribacter sp.]